MQTGLLFSKFYEKISYHLLTDCKLRRAHEVFQNNFTNGRKTSLTAAKSIQIQHINKYYHFLGFAVMSSLRQKAAPATGFLPSKPASGQRLASVPATMVCIKPRRLRTVIYACVD